jgi:hypothetical protein
MIEFRGWSLKKTEEALFPSSQPLRWFAVRPMAAAVNSINEQISHYGPPCPILL